MSKIGVCIIKHFHPSYMVEHLLMVQLVVGSIPHGGSIELFQCSTAGVTKAVVYDILSGMVHIKKTLLLIRKSNPCSGGCGFPFSLSEWSFTICLTPYNRK